MFLGAPFKIIDIIIGWVTIHMIDNIKIIWIGDKLNSNKSMYKVSLQNTIDTQTNIVVFTGVYKWL